MRLVVAGDDALLVVAGGLIVGVDDGVRGHTVGVVRLGPGVDGVDVRDILEHGGTEEGEHSAKREKVTKDSVNCENEKVNAAGHNHKQLY